MEKNTHMTVGLALSSVVMLNSYNLSLKQIVYGSMAAIIASTIPDADLIDNRSANGLIQTIETVKYSEVPMLLYLFIMYQNTGGLTFMKTEWQTYLLKMFMWVVMMHLTVISPHRGWSHSFAWMGMVTGLWHYIFLDANMTKWFALGYLSHLLIDLCNKAGERLLWPAGKPICFGWCTSCGIVNNLSMLVGGVVYLSQLTK